MKTLYTLAAVFFLAQPLLAQTPIIFQPGPGLNDGTDEGGANGGKDVFIGDADNITHGTESAFYILPISNCNNTTWISLFKFDVSTLPTEVDSVLLVITHSDPGTYCYSNCVADFHLAAITEPWSETTVTFSARPAKESTPFYSILNHNWDDSLHAKEYDITQTYRNWATETIPNHGFEFYSSTVGCNNAAVTLYGATSDDTTNAGANRPYLKVYPASVGIQSSLAAQMGLQCYPNPVSNQATLEFTLAATQNIVFELVDIAGRLINTREYALAAGANRITFSLSDVNAGLYYYRLKTNAGEVAGKLIKK